MSDYANLTSINLRRPLISIPVADYNDDFRWQLELFWFAHRRVYGAEAPARVNAIIMKRNDIWEPPIRVLNWNTDIPHTLCSPFFDIAKPRPDATLMHTKLALGFPLNIQIGLAQILPQFDDEQLLEVLDCDMLHFRPCPIQTIGEGQLFACDVYEQWHLFSLSRYREIIAPYFENGGQYYNGGFVPIIARASTFRRILPEWIAVHIDILRRPIDEAVQWWAGMYALQAACEKARVQMISADCCYVPKLNQVVDSHYVGHYCIDEKFNKRTFPNIDVTALGDDPFYQMIRAWLRDRR